MLAKKTLGTGLCLVTIGWGVVRLRGETFVIPEPSARACADGACVPRRLTNGYYQTKWRRWPIEPAAAAKPGVREGISAPGLEAPEPDNETDLPPGAFTAPSPSDEQPTGPDSGLPGSTELRTRPPTRTMPRDDPGGDLPLDLRGAPLPGSDSRSPRYPSDIRPFRRTPAVAAAGGNRAASVLEALRNEASRQHGEEGPSNRSPAPNVLPVEIPTARPLPQVPPAPAHRPNEGLSKSTELSGELNLSRTNTEPHFDAHNRPRNDVSQPINDRRLRNADEQPRWQQRPAHGEADTEGRGPRLTAARLDSIETASSTVPAGLNTPTSIGAQRSANFVLRASATDEPTTTAFPAAVLAVRDQHQSPNLDQPIANPLRGGTPRIAFDRSRGTGEQNLSAEPRGGASSSARLEIPANPLR